MVWLFLGIVTVNFFIDEVQLKQIFRFLRKLVSIFQEWILVLMMKGMQH